MILRHRNFQCLGRRPLGTEKNGVLFGHRNIFNVGIVTSPVPGTIALIGLGLISPHQKFMSFEHFRLVLRGRCRTWSTSGSFCMARAALAASS